MMVEFSVSAREYFYDHLPNIQELEPEYFPVAGTAFQQECVLKGYIFLICLMNFVRGLQTEVDLLVISNI